MARKTDRPADKIWNARRRYNRAAERYERDAMTASPVEAVRLRKQAEYMRQQSELLRKGKDTASGRKKRVQSSFSTLEGVKKDVGKRRDIEAREIMKTNAGKRVYAATTSIWEDSEYSTREQALIEYFGVTDLMGVIELFEEKLGGALYEDMESRDAYEQVALQAILAFNLQ